MNKYVIIDYTYIYVAIINFFSVLLLLLCLVNSQNWLCDTKRILLCFLSCILMPIIKKKYKQKKNGIIPFSSGSHSFWWEVYKCHYFSFTVYSYFFSLLLRFAPYPWLRSWIILCFGVVLYMFILFELFLNFLDLWVYHCQQS